MMDRPETRVDQYEPLGEKLYTLVEVAVLMGVTAATVRNWIKSNRIKAIKHPGGYRVTQSELKRMATSNF